MERRNVLLLGNGINLLYGDKSWETMIREELLVSENSLTWEQIQFVPPTMQIVLATADKVDARLKVIGKTLEKQQISDDRAAFLRRLVELPVEAVLTTNYSLEIERALGFTGSCSSYRSRLIRSIQPDGIRDEFRLYQFYPLLHEDDEVLPLWHIHGDIAKPKSMIMGHYYYAKHLREIQDRAAHMIRAYHGCARAGVAYEPRSWVDWFLIGDLFILGFGLYLCESDLWWLLCCKKRNFPESKIYYYGDIDNERKLLLQAYGGKCMEEIKPPRERDYHGFYKLAMDDIQNRMINQNHY